MTNLSYWLLNDQGKNTASPFSYTFNTNLEYYTWLEEPGNEQRLVRFGHAMHGTQQFEIAENIITGTCPRSHPPIAFALVSFTRAFARSASLRLPNSLARPGTCARAGAFRCSTALFVVLALSSFQTRRAM